MDNKQKAAKYTIKYSALQGSYWPVYCASMSFASVFLLSRDFSNSEIGIVLALANILAVFLQPAIASFADTTTKISLKNLTGLLAVAAAVLAGILFFTPHIPILVSIVMVLELTILLTLQPLANALGMHMINKGIPLNFGLGRGIGSLSFAVFSYIIGYFIERFGADASIVVTFCMLIPFICFSFTFADQKYFQPEAKQKSAGKPLGILGFAKKYTRFVLLLLAVAVTFCTHMMINNYFIQIVENVGGNTKNMGTAIGLAAAVELPAMSLFMLFIKKFRCSGILKLSFFFFLLKSVLTLVAPNVWMLYVAQLVQFSSYALFIPASIYYVNQVIGTSDLVKGQAFMTGAITLGGVLASLIGGILLDGPGVKTMLIVGVIASAIGLALSIPSIECTSLPNTSDNTHQ